ncbi:MAG TPA: hypothetical protein VL284_16710 [Thermoanaerobaculia bacterium]|nr:hypothetical protein [Thermoanaerobaculia bacterium]
MRIRNFITAASIAVLPFAASAATFIVPAAGTGAGANGSQWQSELTFHSTSANPISIGLVFHDAGGAQQGDGLTLSPRSTTTLSDVVKTRFGRDGGTGGIEINVPDAFADRVAITSRTFNASASGEFGQDIPAIDSTGAASAGDVIVLQAPSSATNARFNFGIYAVSDAAVRWDLVRADGTVAASTTQSYGAGTQMQYNQGITSLLGATEQDNDALQATVTSGSVIAYGSAINNQTGDPSFVPGIRTRADIRVNFVGVDVNEDGTPDILDANHDGVLDQPIDIYTTVGYPNYFRVIVNGGATLELVDAPRDAQLIDAETVQYAPNALLKGTTGELKVRATVNGVTDVLTIPVNYR